MSRTHKPPLDNAALKNELELSQGTHTRVFRRRLPDGLGSVICKELFGADAVARRRHETRILERLAGTKGVPQLAGGPHVGEVIVLIDDGSIPLGEALQARPMEVPELLEFARQLADIIAAVHRCGVVHKDVNPSNLLLSGLERAPMLIDFSIATTFAEERPGFAHHHEIVGTLAYIAPEQTGRTGRTVDQRADLYSLGATLYELAVGHPPFKSSDPLELIHDHTARLPIPPVVLNARLPQRFSDIILRLLEKEPDRRYQSAEGLAYDLSRLDRKSLKEAGALFVLGERDFPLRLAAPSRLIGREVEIGALRSAFENALQGSGRGVLVTGAPGVGKTALINELRPMVTARQGWFVSGKFDQYRRDQSADAVRQALRALGRLLLAEPEAELSRLRAHILRALGPNAGLITALLPEFATLLGTAPETVTVDPVEAEIRLRLTVLELLRSIVSPERPLVMIIDDLQWAGSVPIHLIDAMLTAEGLRGLLLVGAYREGEVEATHPLSAMLARWEHLGPAPLMLRLANLRPGDLGMLLEEMLRLQPAQAARLAEAVGARTCGNPYDTLEMLNALRRDGALVAGEEGWRWEAATIRRYVGEGNVVDLLAARIDSLPIEARGLLQMMACLGGEVELDLLGAASGLAPALLDAQLAPALEDGLLTMEQGGAVRFRHDRVQQAAYGHLGEQSRQALHLALARRLAATHELEAVAAEQYLPAIEAVHDHEERRRVIGFFRTAAKNVRLINHSMADRFLAAAIALLNTMETAADAPLFIALETERHAALYSLARHAEADAIYKLIEHRCLSPLDLAEAACVQMNSLCNRGQHQEAVAIGLGLLQRLGLEAPQGDAGAELGRRLELFYQWIAEDAQAEDLRRPETADPRVRSAARLANRMMAPAFFCAPMIMAWLVLESQRLWVDHGPCAALVANISPAGSFIIALKQDFRTGCLAARRALAVGEARGYEPETSWARFCYVLFAAPWFGPLEESIQQAQRAREGLLQGGDLQFACFTHYTSLAAILDCAPSLESCEAEVDAALAFASRTGNDYITASFISYRQLIRALRGETDTLGAFTDGTFDECAHLAAQGSNPLAGSIFHVYRALAAAVFGDAANFARHAEAAMPLLPYVQGFYHTAVANLLQALALAGRARECESDERLLLLAKFDVCRGWMELRAADAPGNFLHLLRLLEAERSWAVNDFEGAIRAFDQAQQQVAGHHRPWHRALIAERAASFYFSQGMEHAARNLLAQSQHFYEVWGASGKVRELRREHAFLRADAGSLRSDQPRRTDAVSADAIDLVAIIRATQALSSETSLAQLKIRVVEILGALTGATTVLVALREESSPDWFLSVTAGEGAALISVEEAGARGLLPLSAFRYAERTREPLLVEDATRDDRFARDPYLHGLERCSLMLVPIFSQGIPRAVLLLENRLSRGAFSADRLDAVMLIAGQLTVSLDNAQLYASLEQKVAERTEALANSLSLIRATLESTTDGILASDGKGKVTGFNEKFLEMWRVPRHLADSSDEKPILEAALRQLKDPAAFYSRVTDLYADPEQETFDLLEFEDGRVYERYSKPQRIEERSVGRVWSFRDVTERKRTEDALRQTQLSVEQAVDAVWWLDSNAQFVYVNEAACRSVGYSGEELRAMKLPDIGAHSTMESWLTLWKNGQLKHEFEDEHRAKDGRVFPVEVTIHRIAFQGREVACAYTRDITQRKRAESELAQIHRRLLDVSRQAGMTEVATSVLHNVGNVLNSMNVSFSMISSEVDGSSIDSVAKVAELLREHEADLPGFFANNLMARQLPGFLRDLSGQLLDEQQSVMGELRLLEGNIEHIKQIVAMQQSYARVGGVRETLSVESVVEDAIRFNAAVLAQHRIAVIREFDQISDVSIEKHKVLQILVNLVRNAKHALIASPRADKEISVRIAADKTRLTVTVSDNGIGIAPENLTRIFAHGFTTKKDGHGFGLHGGVLAAKEMGGHLTGQSKGLGLGAIFTLELPLRMDGHPLEPAPWI